MHQVLSLEFFSLRQFLHTAGSCLPAAGSAGVRFLPIFGTREFHRNLHIVPESESEPDMLFPDVFGPNVKESAGSLQIFPHHKSSLCVPETVSRPLSLMSISVRFPIMQSCRLPQYCLRQFSPVY